MRQSHRQGSTCCRHNPLRKRAIVATLVALAVAFAALVPVTQASTAEAADSQEVASIAVVGGGGYVLQPEEDTTVSELLEDSETQGAGQAENLSGKAFNGAVVDIDPVRAKQLRRDPRVVSVERNRKFSLRSDDERHPLVRPRSFTAPGKGYSTKADTGVWGLDRTDQDSLPLDHDYSPPADGSGVHIYFVDTGIDLDHPDFGGRIGKSVSIRSSGKTPNDCYGHGTHVAGTAGSKTYGMAKESELHSVRVGDCSGWTDLATILAGLNWVASNARARSVVNLSWGGPRSAVLNAAVSRLVDDGIVVAVAAGNEGGVACRISPASARPVIAVGALDKSDEEANFSNYGSCVDVYAPGVDVESLWMNKPRKSLTASGTSMSTPHVAGAIAVLWSQKLSLSGAEVTHHLLNSATRGVVTFPRGKAGSPNRNLHVEPTVMNAPDTILTSGTKGKVQSRRASFTFTATAEGSKFDCKLDRSSWRKCTSAKSYTGLANGKHTFRVRATDLEGDPDPTPAVQKFQTAKQIVVKLRAKTGRRGPRLLIDVNPNLKSKNYRFQVQKKNGKRWKVVFTTLTQGPRDRKTLYGPKGRYRIKVPAQLDLLRGISNTVRLPEWK